MLKDVSKLKEENERLLDQHLSEKEEMQRLH
jgi:hypothetical protein